MHVSHILNHLNIKHLSVEAVLPYGYDEMDKFSEEMRTAGSQTRTGSGSHSEQYAQQHSSSDM